MKKIEATVLVSALFGLASGCAPVDPAETVYGAPRRVGISYVSYGPAMGVSETPLAYLASGRAQLGFESPTGVEVSYALPLKPGFDLKMAVDLGYRVSRATCSWDGNAREQILNTLLAKFGATFLF